MWSPTSISLLFNASSFPSRRAYIVHIPQLLRGSLLFQQSNLAVKWFHFSIKHYHKEGQERGTLYSSVFHLHHSQRTRPCTLLVLYLSWNQSLSRILTDRWERQSQLFIYLFFRRLHKVQIEGSYPLLFFTSQYSSLLLLLLLICF